MAPPKKTWGGGGSANQGAILTCFYQGHRGPTNKIFWGGQQIDGAPPCWTQNVDFFPHCFYNEKKIQCLKMAEFYGAIVATALHTAWGGRVFSRAERPVPPLTSHPASRWGAMFAELKTWIFFFFTLFYLTCKLNESKRNSWQNFRGQVWPQH